MDLTIFNFDKKINRVIVNRGRQYYNYDNVTNINYDQNKNMFTADVLGSEDYYTTATITNGVIKDFTCDCPFDSTCKHIVALLYEIKEDDNLFELAISSSDSNIANTRKNFIEQLKEDVIEFHQEEKEDYEVSIFSMRYRFNRNIILRQNNFINIVLNHFEEIKEYIPLNALKVYIETYLYENFKVVYNAPLILRELEFKQHSEVTDIYYEYIFTRYFNLNNIHEYTVDILSKLIETIERTESYNILFRISNLDVLTYIATNLNKCNYDSKVVKYLFNARTNTSIEKFLVLETILNKKVIVNALDSNFIEVDDFSLSIYLAKQFNYNLNLSLYTNLITEKELSDNFDFLSTNYKVMLNDLLIDILNNKHRYSLFDLKKLHFYLTTNNPNFNYNEFDDIFFLFLINGIIESDNAIILSKEGLPHNLYLDNNIKTAKTNLSTIYYQNKEYDQMNFRIFNDDKEILCAGFISKDKIFFPQTKEYVVSFEEIRNASISVESNDVFNNFIDEINKEKEALKKKQVYEESLKLVQELSNRLLDKSTKLLENKVDLQPIIAFDGELNLDDKVVEYNYDFIVGAKMGISQMYFVKDISDLLNNIQYKKFKKYGIKLAFNHDINSFSNTAIKFIDVLEKYKYFEKYKNNYGSMLDSNKLNSTLELYKGSSVLLYNFDSNYDYIEYLINPIDYDITISLNEESFESNLQEVLNKKNIHLVKFRSFDIIIDKNKNTIQKVNYTNEKQKTINDFLLENSNFDSKVVLDEVIKSVLPLASKQINLSETIEKKVKEYKFSINSYFDYHEKSDKITVASKYFVGDKEVNNKDLSKYEIYLNNYNNLLSSFGFVNNDMTRQDDIILFLNTDLSVLKDLGNVYISENMSNKVIKNISNIKVNVTIQNNLLMSHIESNDLTTEDLSKILEAYKKKKKYVMLKDDIILLDNDNIKDFNRFMEQNEFNTKELDSTYVKPIYEIFKFDEESNIDFIIEDKIKDIINDIANFKSLEINPKPKMLDILKPYQVDGFKWLKVLSKHHLGGILADDMGLGKTLQVITYLESEDFINSIVICPKSLIYNWASEINKFNASFDYLIYTGSKEERTNLFDTIKNNKKKTLIIVSYDTLRNDIEDFSSIEFDSIILDEAQNIKTVNALKTRAVKKLNGNKRFVLTGTPIENSIFDLWSIFDFIMPGFLYNYNKFTKIGNMVHEDDEENLNFLIKKIQPFILRRIKKDVLKQLPEKLEEVVYATFDGPNRKVYDAYLQDVQNRILDPNTGRMEILSDLMRLRQICISPSLLDIDYKDESLKIDFAKNLIEEAVASNHKVLIFSSFVSALNILKDKVSNIPSFTLTGATKAEDRISMSNEFNLEDSKEKIFFISLKAGGTGLNLVGADIVIHLDPWWNLAAENQATDRAHRIGQENIVTVYKIVMKDSIEEKIIELQNIKKDLFDKMIDNNSDVSSISIEDYKYILS